MITCAGEIFVKNADILNILHKIIQPDGSTATPSTEAKMRNHVSQKRKSCSFSSLFHQIMLIDENLVIHHIAAGWIFSDTWGTVHSKISINFP